MRDNAVYNYHRIMRMLRGFTRGLNLQSRRPFIESITPITQRFFPHQAHQAFYFKADWRCTVGRIAIFILACVLTAVILIYGPRWIGRMSAAILAVPPYQNPLWLNRILYAFYTFFVLTAFFPFLLSLGWMSISRFQNQTGGKTPFISLIIPAFNEERCIHRSLEALRHIDYPAFEVIVVNDGSTDFTFSMIESSFVKCIHLRRNQGKAAALNAGIACAKGEIVVFSDSDSWLHPGALRYLVQGFADPSIGAVSGTVEIAQPSTLLKCWQSLEYSYGQFLVKAAQMGSGSTVAICPGPVCAYRRDLLVAMGGFNGRTITEDFDATLEIVKRGYRVVYAPRAVAYTTAPASWNALKYQRLRWFRGHLQAFRVHRDLLGSFRAGALSIYWLPVYYLFLGYGCGLIEMVAIPAFPFLILASGNPWGMLQVAVFYMLLAQLFVMMGCVIALWRARQLRFGLIAAALIIYPYLYYLNWTRLWAVLNEARGKMATWSG